MEKRPPSGVDLSTGRRWLIIRFRAIGDNVMVAWAVSAIRAQEPDAHITWVTEKGLHDVIDTEHLVNDLVLLDRQGHKMQRWNPATWLEQIRYYTQFRGKFDVGLDFQGHLKTQILLWLSRPKQRLALHATDALAKRLNPISKATGTHKVELYMSFLNHIGSYEQPVRPIMPDVTYALPQTHNVVSINTGASFAFKAIPVPVLQDAADQLTALGYFVVGMGGPKDQPLERVHDLCRKTTLRESLGVVRASACHISGDTGSGHIAAAYGVPFVSCFVNLQNHPSVFRPFGEAGTVLMPDEVTAARIVEEVVRWAPLEK